MARLRHVKLRKAVNVDDMRELQHIIARAKACRQDILGIFADCDHWNRTHPSETPIDADPDGKLRQMLARMDHIIAQDRSA